MRLDFTTLHPISLPSDLRAPAGKQGTTTRKQFLQHNVNRRVLEEDSEMDWEGQKLAEQLMQILLVAFSAVAFIVGYLIGSFQMMLLVYLGGVVLTALVIVPNWPPFNRHPLKWLQPSEAERHPKPVREKTSSNSKKKPLKNK